MSTTELAPAFFLALIVILVVCRLVGWALRGLGQPPVVGEMIAGVVLGPSVLGLLAPGVEAAVFGQQVRPVLYVVGQIGLVVFMFKAGYEFRTDRMRQVARPAAVISSAGMLVPLVLGLLLAFVANGHVPLFPDNVSFAVSASFFGVTLAITAFPMLARIITERGLSGTRFGSVALACGALDDAVAWVLLAAVLSLRAGSAGPVAIAVGGALVLAAGLIGMAGVRARASAMAERLAPDRLLLVVVVALFLFAWYTDKIGLYAVFGAFSLGVAVPRTAAVDRVVTTITPVATVFLPLFFTYSGLNTDFGLLVAPAVLLFTVAALVAAVVGKLGACWAGARLTGESRPVAVRVGILMNARGLMQLIAINVGLSAGIVTPALFSVLVVIALVTTVMATPLLSWQDRRERRRETPAPTTGRADAVA